MIVPSGKVSTIAGLPGVWGNANGSNSAARFFQPQGIVADNGGDLIVADSGNQTLRRISPSAAGWMVTTIAGTPGSAGCADGRGEAAQFVFPSGLALDGAGFLYIADSGNHLIRTTRDVPPTLRFETSGDHLTLFWPSSSSGFVLETKPTLALGESWQAATNAVTDTGDNLVVTISADCAASFYRLRKP
jgi:hypothetical protein